MLDHKGKMQKTTPREALLPETMKEGINLFLSSIPNSFSQKEISNTIERVANAWVGEFLSGYCTNPEIFFKDPYQIKESGPIILTNIQFVSVCPHHLLPYSGIAHVAYCPKENIIGLGQISKLINCFSRRLILQEILSIDIAESFEKFLDTSGSACMLIARHSCMALRGDRQSQNNLVTSHFVGSFRDNKNLQELFLNMVYSQGQKV